MVGQKETPAVVAAGASGDVAASSVDSTQNAASPARVQGAEQFGTGSKMPRGRGMARESIALIREMRDIAEATQPITGRGLGYKLFTRGLIPSMSRADMQRVYRLLREARERDLIPWDWITDET